MNKNEIKNINMEARPDPEYLLAKIKSEDNRKGLLKIFFGYSAGVGKTYAMLDSAQSLKKSNVDVVVGYIEPHTRPETIALLEGLELLGAKNINYKGILLKEFDLDGALKRKPEVILVDELAHTNAIGSRHNKRWQDIYELIHAGIDVYTTVNVQHIESLNDVIASITNVFVKETIPDKVFDEANYIELVDIEPQDLLKRFNDGKVYKKDKVENAQNNFFQKENLIALREIALRRTADHVNKEIEIVRLSKGNIKTIPIKEQLLVCISSSPSSSTVIRTAARMANSVHSNWIAAYVQASDVESLDKDSQENLRKNMSLAEELGAEVVVLHGNNIAEQVVNYANIRNVTKIVIGRNQKKISKIYDVFHRDIVGKLLDMTSYIDIHVIPGISIHNKIKDKNKIQNKDWASKFIFSRIGLLKITGVLIFSTIIAYLFYNIGFAEANIIMTYIVGILVISLITKGYLMGIIGSIISVLAFNYFFTEPRFTFSVDDVSYLATFPIMLLVTLITSALTSRIQHQAEMAVQREKHNQMLYDITRGFLNVFSKEAVIEKGIEYLTNILNREIVGYFSDKNEELGRPILNIQAKQTRDLLDKNEKAVVNWVFKNIKKAGVGTDTLPGSIGYYIPVKTNQKIMGVIGIKCVNNPINLEQRKYIDAVIAQMAIALEREKLVLEQERVKVEIEREKLRSDLLRAISHDLRSPLAGIAGATTTILENEDTLDKVTVHELLNGIYEDSEWLTRLVENLLSMTKIDEGKLNLKKTPEAVEEVISEVIHHISKRSQNHIIKVEIPDSLLIVPMDGKLIEQVLINLIDNAIKYTPFGTTIEIKVSSIDKLLYMEVSDTGGGLPPSSIDNIFDRFFVPDNSSIDSRRGIGLGLAICKSIIEAHGGEIKAYNKENKGGAIFRFSIPLL